MLCRHALPPLLSAALSLTPMLPAAAQQPEPAALRSQAEIGAAYVAAIACSGVFVSGRPLDAVLATDLAPQRAAERMLRALLRVEVDRDAGTVTATALGVSRTALFRPGNGSTLALGRSVAELRAQPAQPVAGARPAAPWPLGSGPAAAPGDGVDAAALAAAIDRAFAEPAAGPPVATRAVVVVHRGALIAERYAAGFGPDTALTGWSMTKSVVDALVGIRVGTGAIDPSAPMPLRAWPEDDPRAAITWNQMLWMSSGLRWQERYDDPAADPVRMLFAVPDAAAFAADRPLDAAPGSRWAYSSGTTNLICRALRESFDDHGDYLAFPRRALFERIGMHSAALQLDPSGTFVGSSFLYATARDWARFGLLYLRGGVWQGQRVLPEGWVETSTTPASTAPQGRYGRHWWLNAGDPGGTDRPMPQLPADMFRASGFEGQTLAVLPSDDLIVVRLGCTKSGQFDVASLLDDVRAACSGQPR